MLGVNKFRASDQRTEGTGETKSGAESEANKFSAAPMLFFWPNSAPNLGRIPSIESRRVSEVQISLSPPAQNRNCEGLNSS
jgi:hypothetical protein